MPITYAIDRALGVIFETWNGPIYARDLSAFWKDYLEDPVVLSCRRTLVDLRNCTVEFHGGDLAHLVESLVLPRIGPMKWRSALLVGHAVQFGVARQYEVFAEFYSQDAVFVDQQSALDWLLKEGPDAS